MQEKISDRFPQTKSPQEPAMKNKKACSQAVSQPQEHAFLNKQTAGKSDHVTLLYLVLSQGV